MFAKCYDALMADVDYGLLVLLFEAHKPYTHPIVIDAGCGTGNFLLELAKLGENVYGIDKDEDMLGIAQNKLQENHLYAPLFVHDLKDPLTIKADMIISFFDVVNYFKGTKTLFRNMYRALNKNGVYLFDCYKEDVLNQYDGYQESGDDPIDYEWTIHCQDRQLRHQVKFGNETEHITQYVHPIETIKEQLTSLGFKVTIEDGVDPRKWYVIAKKG